MCQAGQFWIVREALRSSVAGFIPHISSDFSQILPTCASRARHFFAVAFRDEMLELGLQCRVYRPPATRNQLPTDGELSHFAPEIVLSTPVVQHYPTDTLPASGQDLAADSNLSSELTSTAGAGSSSDSAVSRQIIFLKLSPELVLTYD